MSDENNTVVSRVKNALNTDGVGVVPALFDLLVLGGVPVTTMLSEITRGSFSYSDKVTFRKTVEAAQVLVQDLESGLITQAQLGLTLSNLKEEHGHEYFDEAFFHAIQNSDSKKRANYIGNLISSAIQHEQIRDLYYDFLAIVQTLTMKDINLLKPASADSRRISPENPSFIRPTVGVTTAKQFRDYYGLPRLLRYQSVGLTKGTDTMADANIPLVDNQLADLLLSSIGELPQESLR